MSAPTRIEREHYGTLVGRRITAIHWQEIDGQPLPILLLDGKNRDGSAATVTVLADPEGNGPGHLKHRL